jgi:hypothetical protein
MHQLMKRLGRPVSKNMNLQMELEQATCIKKCTKLKKGNR